jgi:hypothetical protein
VHAPAAGADGAGAHGAAWEKTPVDAEAPVDPMIGEMVTYPVDAELADDAEAFGEAR